MPATRPGGPSHRVGVLLQGPDMGGTEIPEVTDHGRPLGGRPLFAGHPGETGDGLNRRPPGRLLRTAAHGADDDLSTCVRHRGLAAAVDVRTGAVRHRCTLFDPKPRDDLGARPVDHPVRKRLTLLRDRVDVHQRVPCDSRTGRTPHHRRQPIAVPRMQILPFGSSAP